MMWIILSGGDVQPLRNFFSSCNDRWDDFRCLWLFSQGRERRKISNTMGNEEGPGCGETMGIPWLSRAIPKLWDHKSSVGAGGLPSPETEGTTGPPNL